MPKRPCLKCGRLTTNASRCDIHQKEWMAAQQRKRDAERGSASQRGYDVTYRRVRAQVLKGWRSQHGDYCPGWGIPAHSAQDLTVDHIIPLAAGGTHHRENLRVLCRSCNSRRGSKPDNQGGSYAL
ncbi:HNH endonuclease [Streptomyces sp. NPDC007206]|uniref:HNH endonuclease n=1 Tax=Streptomyces sp. NPDC007206 TaxID=3154317 RepID=UPI0034087EA9